jgi:hypothetical protein
MKHYFIKGIVQEWSVDDSFVGVFVPCISFLGVKLYITARYGLSPFKSDAIICTMVKARNIVKEYIGNDLPINYNYLKL